MKGKFITFEGPEKSGKSTQAKLLSEYLKTQGYKTLFIREPGSTKIGEKIRTVLLDKKSDGMSVMAEVLLYMAARAQLIDEVIKPALKKGFIVLCDRFQDSTIVYQGYGCGLDLKLIKMIGSRVTQGVKPDLTLLLDFWESKIHLRNDKAPDRIELRSDAFHARVRRGYFLLAKKEPQRIKIVKVQPAMSQTQEKIREIVIKCLLKRS